MEKTTNSEPNRAAAVGMFDGVHLGHQRLIGELSSLARERGMISTVFTFDRHPLELIAPEKAPMLLTTPVERGHLLVEAGAEDVFVLTFNEALRNYTAREFLSSLRDHYGVRLLLVGFNHRFGHDRIDSFDEYRRLGEECGVEVVRAESLVEDGDMPVSSSAIRAALSSGDFEHALRMLGHPYSLGGVVVHGNAIGRELGFPTANLSLLRRNCLVPAIGVYAANVILYSPEGFTSHPGMVSIGRRPTVNDNPCARLRIETHIIGFEGNIYNKHMELQLIARMRDERKFDDASGLVAQLELDRAAALEAYRRYMNR